MENLKISFIIGYFSLIMLFGSCTREPIDNYRKCIVYEKRVNFKSFILKKNNSVYESTFITVYVLDRDFLKYEVGDTIK